MNIMIFDTETTSINKPFCYNVGYCIYNTEEQGIIFKRDYVVEQTWHNIPLFSTAYYADKRPLYVKSMRAKKTKLEKWGFICQQMIRDIKAFNIEGAYAYNAPFDENVFNFNCDYFKTFNPFDTIPIFDIRGYVHETIAETTEFKEFCDTHNCYTDSGNYSTTAETIYRYITNNADFIEAHTALNDSEIELDILTYCIENYNVDLQTVYKTKLTIEKRTDKTLEIYINKKLSATEVFNKKLIKDNKKDGITKIYLTKD